MYTDKHLAYNWTDAKWMYDRAQELGIPFMAGSSVPLFWRTPWLEHPLECPIKEALFLSFGSLEGYGYHGLETLQSFVERRAGGEVGLRAVTMLEGEQVWAAGREGRWSSKLLDFAIAHGQQTLVGNRKYTAPTYAVAPGRPEDFDFTSGEMTEANPRGMKSDPTGGAEGPYAFVFEYADGFRATQLHLTACALIRCNHLVPHIQPRSQNAPIRGCSARLCCRECCRRQHTLSATALVTE